jgi:hypothetical protein
VKSHADNGGSGKGQPRAEARAAIFNRAEELGMLRQRLAQRRAFLFHGPAGVGKTLLLSAVVPEFPDILYSRSNPTPQALYRNLAELLLAAGHPVFTRSCVSGPASLQAKSAVSLKGLVREALLDSRYLVVVDHLTRPSHALGAAVRELMSNWSVPVVAVARSAHMEDVGFVLPLFPDRSDKLALKNFDADRAAEFAAICARGEGVNAENLAQFLAKVVEYSEGNPGAMLRMIRLARDPRYVLANQIKITPLYIDYKIATVND